MSAAPPAPTPWRRRLDTLRVKLFLAIAGANVVLVMAAYLVYSWSFDQGLGEYLNRAEEARLTPLVTRLAEGHRTHGGWDWLVDDRQRFPELVREVLGVGRFPRRPAEGTSAPPPPPREASGPAAPPLLTFDPRLLLFDAQGALLQGPPERAEQAVRRPIVVDGATVGYLGYMPRLQIVASLERVFAQQQNRKFAAIAVGLLAAVLLNAALIAQWLSRRLKALGEGAAALARGEYGTRIPITGHDELAQLAGDFNHLAAVLEAVQRARQQWVADIAHELRTPLATLRAEIEALQDGVRPLSQAGMASLAQEVHRLARLVEDLRLLSLSDLGALTYHREPVALDEVVEDSLHAARAAVRERGLQLRLDLAPDVRVMADGDRLAQVFGNLLQNTLRYTHAPAQLEVTLRRDGRQAHLVWQDSPPGVAAEHLPHLTERLYRIEASRSREGGGSGLGLAIVQAIVEAHGGRLQAGASALGGLRWDVWLPLLEDGHA